MSFDPFRFRQAVRADQREHPFAQKVQAALGAPHSRAFLEELLRIEEARPSYEPGLPFDTVAWREGRKAMLRQLINALNTRLPEQTDAA